MPGLDAICTWDITWLWKCPWRTQLSLKCSLIALLWDSKKKGLSTWWEIAYRQRIFLKANWYLLIIPFTGRKMLCAESSQKALQHRTRWSSFVPLWTAEFIFFIIYLKPVFLHVVLFSGSGLNRNLWLRFAVLLGSTLDIIYIIMIAQWIGQLISSLAVTKNIKMKTLQNLIKDIKRPELKEILKRISFKEIYKRNCFLYH